MRNKELSSGRPLRTSMELNCGGVGNSNARLKCRPLEVVGVIVC